MKYDITVHPSGIRVVTEHLPYVKSFSLGFMLDVGSRDELPEEAGISHFIEHMLFKGTEKRTAKRIADDIESTGGYLNAFTSKEHTCYYGRGLSKYLTKTFSVLADMIQNSTFMQKEIKKESSVVIDELYDIEDSPEELIFDKFETNIYKGNTLEAPIIGTEDNLQRFTHNDLKNYVAKNYGFNKLVIVASGNVKHKRMLELVDKYFVSDLGISNTQRNNTILQPYKNLIINKEVQQTHMIIGSPTIGYDSIKERTKVNILSQILGEGSSSRLFQRVRERNGIAYQINTFLNSFYDISTFGVYISTNERSFGKACDLIYDEFEKIKKTPVSEKELKRAKEYLKGSILMSMESTTNRMTRMAQSMMYYNRVRSVEESIENIDNVTREEVLEYANKLLDDELLNKVILSSGKSKMKAA